MDKLASLPYLLYEGISFMSNPRETFKVQEKEKGITNLLDYVHLSKIFKMNFLEHVSMPFCVQSCITVHEFTI